MQLKCIHSIQFPTQCYLIYLSIYLYPSLTSSRIPHTRLHIPIIRRIAAPSSSSSIRSSALCTTHPWTLLHGHTTPSLLHNGWRSGLITAGLAGAAAAASYAAEDGDEEEAAYAGADADDEVFVVVDPAADFFGGGGTFALALRGKVSS